MFWPYANNHLSAAEAAGGFALINSCGQIAGFVSPYLFGLIIDHMGSIGAGQWVLAGVLLVGAVLGFGAQSPTARLAPGGAR
jgi:MFS-type transporter involved in bile tolerance (Atg22 family)